MTALLLQGQGCGEGHSSSLHGLHSHHSGYRFCRAVIQVLTLQQASVEGKECLFMARQRWKFRFPMWSPRPQQKEGALLPVGRYEVLAQYSVFSDMIPARVSSHFSTTLQRCKSRLPIQALLAQVEFEPQFFCGVWLKQSSCLKVFCHATLLLSWTFSQTEIFLGTFCLPLLVFPDHWLLELKVQDK